MPRGWKRLEGLFRLDYYDQVRKTEILLESSLSFFADGPSLFTTPAFSYIALALPP